MARRAALLISLIAVAVGVAACGRASQAEIDQALGITPTPTPSQEQIAASTAAAASAVAAQTAAAANPAPGGGQAAAVGDVTRGSRQFTTQCAGCHRPGGPGGDILAPGGPGVDVTYETLLPLIREGNGHPVPPGPYPATLLSDSAVQDLAAFIRSRAAP
jgi:mono/diheme cytochrome c family protein